jgi:pimeloyl-ACP methyl ester carboxylesterase
MNRPMEKPIEWLGVAGILAQFIAGPFLQTHFDDYKFPESLTPEIENPLPAWVVIVGAFGALAAGWLALRYRDLVHTRLADVPLPYRSIVERSATTAAVWAVAEFLIALQLISGLHPPVWNTIRWVVMPLAGAGLVGSVLFYAYWAFKERRNKEFKAFWKNFDLTKQSPNSPGPSASE